MAARDTVGADGGKAPPDHSKLYAAVGKLGTLPFSRTAIRPLAVAALAPLLAAGATQLPLRGLWSVVRRLLVV